MGIPEVIPKADRARIVQELVETTELESTKPEVSALPELACLDAIQAWLKDGDPGDIKLLVPVLQKLDPLDYDRVRGEVADRAGVRKSSLDAEVQGKQESEDGKKEALKADDFKPWHEPVQLAELLDELKATFLRFLILPEKGASTLALWTLFSHAWFHFDTLPILAVCAPEKRCGKSRTLNVLSTVVRRGKKCDNLTAPVLFRLVDQIRPTVLLDELDCYLPHNDELRGIINAGHDPEGVVYRCCGDAYEIVPYQAGSPKAITGIGKFPGTIEDRSIVINIRRKFPEETVERWFASRRKKELKHLGRKANRWVEDHGVKLEKIVPVMPSELNDRAQDNWWPLFAIAEKAGGHWPEHARQAALISNSKTDEDSTRTQLLADVRLVFIAEARDRIHSQRICDALAKMEGQPWPEWRRGKPMTPTALAHQLRPFGVRPKQIMLDGTNKSGWERKDFEDAWNRYVTPRSPKTTRTPASAEVQGISEPLESNPSSTLKNDGNTHPQRVLGPLEDGWPGSGRGEG